MHLLDTASCKFHFKIQIDLFEANLQQICGIQLSSILVVADHTFLRYLFVVNSLFHFQIFT